MESATTKRSEPVNSLICNLHSPYRSLGALLLLTKTDESRERCVTKLTTNQTRQLRLTFQSSLQAMTGLRQFVVFNFMPCRL